MKLFNAEIKYIVHKKKMEFWRIPTGLLFNLHKSFFHSGKDKDFQLSIVTVFVKFEEKLSEYKSNKIAARNRMLFISNLFVDQLQTV